VETDNNLVSELTSAPILIGKWTFYPDILQLECGDKNIKLEPRTASLLLHLTQNAGNPVSRDILMEKTWPGMVVGDEALTSAINKLRNAFGDDSHHPEVIETIPKVGYRLIAKVEFSASENALCEVSTIPRNRKIVIGAA
jgi:transcriptional activator of cad operon